MKRYTVVINCNIHNNQRFDDLNEAIAIAEVEDDAYIVDTLFGSVYQKKDFDELKSFLLMG